jgi:hypothetical protein
MSDRPNQERELLAAGFVAESAQLMLALSAALLASVCAVDTAAIEARLWEIRRTLIATIASWREAAPPLDDDGGAR